MSATLGKSTSAPVNIPGSTEEKRRSEYALQNAEEIATNLGALHRRLCLLLERLDSTPTDTDLTAKDPQRPTGLLPALESAINESSTTLAECNSYLREIESLI